MQELLYDIHYTISKGTIPTWDNLHLPCSFGAGHKLHCPALGSPGQRDGVPQKPQLPGHNSRASPSLSACPHSFTEECRAHHHCQSSILFLHSCLCDLPPLTVLEYLRDTWIEHLDSSKAVPSKEMEIPFPIWYRQLWIRSQTWEKG